MYKVRCNAYWDKEDKGEISKENYIVQSLSILISSKTFIGSVLVLSKSKYTWWLLLNMNPVQSILTFFTPQRIP